MSEVVGALSKVCAGCGARYPADALFCPVDGMPLQSAASAGRDTEDDPYLGQEISGHIEICQLIGIGAMGRVYRAFQRGIDRDVAVKILHRELSANAQLVSRFTREAKVASRLQHPNVVQVLLAGQLPDRALYMVMEYLEGLSLQSALAAAGGALPLSKALHITLQLCEASGEAHAVGIVHRDLKPENVMLVRRGTDDDFVKVLDFGIARVNWGEQSMATAAGLIFGTARYISPEGAQGNAVGPASDVYSIATLLFQMLSGRTPFEGDQAVGLLVQQIHDAPPHLKSIARAAYVPDPLADVIMANLAKDPNHREPDARALGHAIIDAAKASGLAPEEISRPLLRRTPSVMQLPPNERTKQLDISPELAARMSPPPANVEPDPRRADNAASGSTFSPSAMVGDRPVSAATAKWEPPEEFQARLTDIVNARNRPSGVVPAESPSARPMAAPLGPSSRPRSPSGVDETMDDASVDPPLARRSDPSTQMKSAPRTMPGSMDPLPLSTRYGAPAPEPAPAVMKREASEAAPRRSRGIALVILCFVLGMTMAAGWAWKMGKLGGTAVDDERYIARASEAMYKNRFATPPGENVRDITDEGLKKWPNHHKLLDIRMRAANALVSQALTQRSAGDIVEAIRLARVAHELDPNDPAAKRLVEQYEGELASFTTPSATPLGKPPPSLPVSNAKPPLGAKVVPPGIPSTSPPQPPVSAAGSYKVLLEASVAQPRLGQTVEFTARVAPSRGSFDGALFTLTGPGLGGGATMPAQSPAPGVFKASYAFLEAGRFDVTFTAQTDGKALKVGRSLTAGEPVPKPLEPSPKTTGPAPTGSVKWM